MYLYLQLRDTLLRKTYCTYASVDYVCVTFIGHTWPNNVRSGAVGWETALQAER